MDGEHNSSPLKNQGRFSVPFYTGSVLAGVS
jgi:hypothetical protein